MVYLNPADIVLGLLILLWLAAWVGLERTLRDAERRIEISMSTAPTPEELLDLTEKYYKNYHI